MLMEGMPFYSVVVPKSVGCALSGRVSRGLLLPQGLSLLQDLFLPRGLPLPQGLSLPTCRRSSIDSHCNLFQFHVTRREPGPISTHSKRAKLSSLRWSSLVEGLRQAHGVVPAPLSLQFFMRARLCDSPIFYDENHVCVSSRTKPMSDGDGGMTRHGFL